MVYKIIDYISGAAHGGSLFGYCIYAFKKADLRNFYSKCCIGIACLRYSFRIAILFSLKDKQNAHIA